MKKYFIIAASALVAMCACSKTEVNTIDAPDQEINFQVANYLSQTKADEVAFTGDSFGVYAFYDSDATNATAEQGQTFMANEKVVPSHPGWQVEGKTYYWPKSGNIDFFAYAPYAASGAWVTYKNSDHTLAGSFTSTTGEEDYLYSSMAMNYTNNDPKYKVSPTDQDGVKVSDGVPILFHHALAKLTVKFAAAQLDDKDGETDTDYTRWEITVNTAEFKSVVKKGTLSMDLSSTEAGVQAWDLPTNKVWTPSDVAADKVALNAANAQALTLTATTQDGKLSEYTVLPQALAGMIFHINYTIKAYKNESTTPYSTETIDEKLPVAGTDGIFKAAGNNWEMNKKYTYTVTIAPSTSIMYFDPAVAPWDEASASHTIEK